MEGDLPTQVVEVDAATGIGRVVDVAPAPLAVRAPDAPPQPAVPALPVAEVPLWKRRFGAAAPVPAAPVPTPALRGSPAALAASPALVSPAGQADQGMTLSGLIALVLGVLAIFLAVRRPALALPAPSSAPVTNVTIVQGAQHVHPVVERVIQQAVPGPPGHDGLDGAAGATGATGATGPRGDKGESAPTRPRKLDLPPMEYQ